MEKTDCRELLEVHRNVIDVESITFLMILLAPEVSFVTLHMRWHKGCFPKASTKTHTKHLLKYTYHEKPKGLHDYLHMYGFQTHRIQIYAKLRIANIMLFCAIYRTIETTRYNNDMENNAVCRGNQHCEK